MLKCFKLEPMTLRLVAAAGCIVSTNSFVYGVTVRFFDNPEQTRFANSTETTEEAKILAQGSSSQAAGNRQTAAVRTQTKIPKKAIAQAKRAAVRHFFLQDPSVSRAISDLISSNNRIFSQLQSVITKLVPPASHSKDPAGTSTMQVSFNKQEVEDELQKLTGSNYRVVTLLPEFSDEQPLSSRRIETAVEKELVADRFEVYDWNFVAADQPIQNLVDSTLRGQHPAYGQIASRFHANWIIVGRVEANFSQDNQGILSFRAHCDAKAINVASGRTIPLDSYDSVGFADTRTKARDQALDKMASLMKADVPKQLTMALPIHQIKFLSSTATPAQTAVLADRLKNQPGVEDVQVVQNGTVVTISAMSRDKLSAITTQIQSDYPNFNFDSDIAAH